MQASRGTIDDILLGTWGVRERSHVRPSSAGTPWLFISVLAVFMLCAARPAAPQFTPFSHDPRNILEGNWQSCLQREGFYSERVYDHLLNGVGRFEVHMGPRREFAIFKDVQEAHRSHD